jgi:hypothetical protein
MMRKEYSVSREAREHNEFGWSYLVAPDLSTAPHSISTFHPVSQYSSLGSPGGQRHRRMSLPSAVPCARASPALARDTPSSCRRACTRHHPLGGAEARSGCGLACRYTRGGARRLPVALAAGGTSGELSC